MKDSQHQKRQAATTLLQHLLQDPDFIRHEVITKFPPEQQEQIKIHAEQYKLAAAPLVAELTQAGFSVDVISDLHRYKSNYLRYKNAVPILLHWLPRISNLDVKGDIVRTLTDKKAKPEALPILINEFRQADNAQFHYKWGIGNALSVMADDSVFQDIVALVRDKRHGRAREMLAVALGNMKQSASVDVLLGLLADDEVAGHAILALKKLKAKKAAPYLERFLAAPQTWVRAEAKRALANLKKA